MWRLRRPEGHRAPLPLPQTGIPKATVPGMSRVQPKLKIAIFYVNQRAVVTWLNELGDCLRAVQLELRLHLELV